LLEILRKLLQQADPSRTAGEIKRKASLAAQKISPSRERLQMIFCGWIHHFGIACSNGCG
jgi:hypothetical protein